MMQNKISYTTTNFNKNYFIQKKKHSILIFWLVIVATLSLSAIVFAIRDGWFTDIKNIIWEDYILYFLLTIGISIATIIKNKILLNGHYFESKEISYIDQDIYVEQQKELLKNPLMLSKELLDLKINQDKLLQYCQANNVTIEGVVKLLQELS